MFFECFAFQINSKTLNFVLLSIQYSLGSLSYNTLMVLFIKYALNLINSDSQCLVFRVQLMKNGGKNKCVAFIVLFSI